MNKNLNSQKMSNVLTDAMTQLNLPLVKLEVVASEFQRSKNIP